MWSTQTRWRIPLALGVGLNAGIACSKPFTNTPGVDQSGGAPAGSASGGSNATSGSKATGASKSTGGTTASAGSGGGPPEWSGGTKSVNGFGGKAGASNVAGAGGSNDDSSGGVGGAGAGGSEDSGGAAGGDGSGYRAAVLNATPLAYWRMGISTGRVVPDESGHGNDLVLQGTGHRLAVEGAIVADDDRAMRFDGEASFAIATDARVLDFASAASFSLEAWARRETGGSSYFQHLLSNTVGSPGARTGFMLYLLPEPGGQDSARSAFEYDSPGSETGLWGPLPAASTWAHYVAVFDGVNVTLYVDATLADTAKIVGVTAARSGTFAVARASNGGLTFFKGALDELAIYAHALPLSEISKHFELGAGL